MSLTQKEPSGIPRSGAAGQLTHAPSIPPLASHLDWLTRNGDALSNPLGQPDEPGEHSAPRKCETHQRTVGWRGAASSLGALPGGSPSYIVGKPRRPSTFLRHCILRPCPRCRTGTAFLSRRDSLGVL